jgi:hypothetical protein
MVNTGITHMKKCRPILGVNQYFPGARNLTFHAICILPENEHVFLPHSGSFFPSHNSLFLTKNILLINNNPAKNAIYMKNLDFL